MGEVAVGDELIGADGKPTRVVAATDVMLGRPCYRGRVLGRHGDRRRRRAPMADGDAGVAEVGTGRRGRIQPLQESAHVRLGPNDPRDRRDAAVPDGGSAAEPFGRQRRAAAGCRIAICSVPPYTLGAWLGDGTSAAAQITSADPEIIMRIEAEGLIARPSTAAKYRYQLLLPESGRTVERVPALCAARRSCRRRARSGRAADRAADARGSCLDQYLRPLARGAAGRSCGLRLCQKCRNTVGTLQARLRTHRGPWGTSTFLQDYLRASEAAATCFARRTARHRWHGDRRRSGAVLL